MIKLKIVNIKSNTYNLIDKNNNKYSLNLEFVNFEEKPEINDYIFICEKLLDKNYEGYCGFYSFGPLNMDYGKENVLPSDIDSLIIIKNDKKICLKRLYG